MFWGIYSFFDLNIRIAGGEIVEIRINLLSIRNFYGYDFDLINSPAEIDSFDAFNLLWVFERWISKTDFVSLKPTWRLIPHNFTHIKPNTGGTLVTIV